MSCRSTKGGTASLRYIRRAFGLSDKQATSLFHALKREGADLESPDEATVDEWRLRLREQLDSIDETESQKARSSRDLLAAGSETYDGATFYALHMLNARAQQELVIEKARAKAARLDEPGAHKDFYELDEEGLPAKVWYASYGSNVNEERFNSYLTGEDFEGMGASSGGARDKTLPSDSAPMIIPGRLVFASRSGRWGSGGIAFVDTDDVDSASLGKAYAISREQFEDVLAQESGRSAGTAEVDWYAVSEDGEYNTSGLYGRIVHIGDYKGAPVLTLTSDYVASELAEDYAKEPTLSYRRLNKPHRNYVKTIGSGLESAFGLTQEEQAQYMSGALGGHFYDPDELRSEMSQPYQKITYTSKSNTASKYSSGSRKDTSSMWDKAWQPQRDYVPWWEDENDPVGGKNVKGSYRDDEVPDWWFDIDDEQDDAEVSRWLDDTSYDPSSSPMALRPDSYSYKNKSCVICMSKNHSMHDCPYFDR